MRLLRHWRWVLPDFAYAARVRIGIALRRFPAIRAGGDRAPVVVIPGVFEGWQFMVPVATRLAREGHPVHVVTGLRVNRVPIPQAARIVRALIVERDLRGVIVVGHSKGGLIGKLLLMQSRAAGFQRVERVIALASPFSGSSYARYVPSPPLRAFRPEAPVIARLAAEADVNARITSIYPGFDAQVPEGSVLPGARNIEVPGCRGHFAILKDPDALELVVAEATANRES
jgi:pimeloyl-ACP methyl ester carboxylesterase